LMSRNDGVLTLLARYSVPFLDIVSHLSMSCHISSNESLFNNMKQS